jgi:hypothetical protein
MQRWFNDREALPPNTMIATTSNGWILDEQAVQWFQSFIKATNERKKKEQIGILIFDGHGPHLTVEFLQACETNGIIPFGFLPYTTHLCQPLDGKPFLTYKQHFRRMNNELSYWAGEAVGRVIRPVREKTFNQRIIVRPSKIVVSGQSIVR